MSEPSTFFTADHRHCDETWADLEACATRGDAEGTRAAWARFDHEMRRHFTMEEEVLFPAVEDATGMQGGGPTQVMRHEHVQMRAILDQMARAAAEGRTEALLDHGDSLLMLIQQHNVKEERILYPMADQVLGAAWPGLEERLGSYR